MPNRITLREIAKHTRLLEVRCSRCPRAGRLSVARLLVQHGLDAGVPMDLMGDCPRRHGGWYEKCDLYWPQLTEWF
jgi:hypothetical protein